MASIESADIHDRVDRFRSEEKCRAYLEALRWPDGVSCIRCGSKSVSRIHGRGQFDCNSCRHQFSVTAGTYLQDSHLPLWKWVLAVYLMAESDGGASANQIKTAIGVSYKTAWHLCHRVRAAVERERGSNGGGSQRTVVGGVMQGAGNVRVQAVRGADRLSLGRYHKVSLKHLDAYLNELEWRFSTRDNPWVLRDTLTCLLSPGSLTYEDLTR